MANETESEQELNATQLDAQRARHLLDRALGLAERDDVAGAIVMCRQSLVLAPHSPQGWSMLGLLHERDDDIDGAIEAYEKTLQLSPTSTLERESLQRLRQKRGAAPRPAPKFNFDEVSAAPQVPTADVQPHVSKPLPMDSGDTRPPASALWNTFYFRSLPVLVAAVACLGLILVAQRVAANRQVNSERQMPAVPAVASSPQAPAQPATPMVTPGALASPPVTPAPQSGQAGYVDSSQTTANDDAPAPVITPKPAASRPAAAPKPAPKPKPKPKPKPAPQAAPPSEMPVLPRPRLTLPQRPAPTPTVPSNSRPGNDTSADMPIIGGGPVDVGNSEDSRYIPVNPPQFPNANRD